MKETWIKPKPKELLIFTPNSKGKPYHHQYDGVGCNQFREKGTIKRLGFSSNKVFNPDFWYNAYHRTDEKTGGYFLLPHKFLKNDSHISWKQLEIILQQSPHKIYLIEIVRIVQGVLNRLCKGKPFKYYISLENPNLLKEGLVPIRKEYQSKRFKPWTMHYLIWANCD